MSATPGKTTRGQHGRPARRRPGRATRTALMLLLSMLLGAAPSLADTPPPTPADLLRDDPELTLPQRREIAAAALAHWPDPGRDALVQALRGRGPGEARLATLQAIAASPQPLPGELLQPLLALVPEVQAGEVDALAEALARYEHERVGSLAARVAGYDQASVDARRVAARVLASLRTQPAAAALLELIEPDVPEALRHEAFDALIRMTGLAQHGRDAAAWRQWWAVVGELSPAQWREHLLVNFDGRVRQQAQALSRLERRLVEAQRALYRQLERDERAAMLARMLADEELAIRQLAMELAVQRLVDGRSFEDELRRALRGRIYDPDATVRSRAILLLRDLADAEAAELVAARMAAEAETAVAVQRAELLLVARLPRVEAVETALKRLARPGLRNEAAGAVAAAAEADRVTYQQGRRALALVREALGAGAAPSAQVVRLLAALGQEEDWQRIEAWLDAEASSVRQAAAQAWADSDRPLGPLLTRLGDRQIESIVLAAIARRADRPQTLHTLVEHYLDAEREARDEQAWQRALLALASRVDGRSVLEAIEALRGASGQEPAVNNGVSPQEAAAALADAALDRDGALARRAELELHVTRAWLYVEVERSEPALSHYERAEALLQGEEGEELDNGDAQRWRQRIERGRLLATLRGEAGEALEEDARALARAIDEALSAWEVDQPTSPGELALATARQRLQAVEDADAMQSALDGVGALLAAALDEELSQRWRELGRSLAQADAEAGEVEE